MNKDEITKLLTEADDISYADNFLKQIEIYKKVLQFDSTNIEALINISDCFLKMKLYDNAKEFAFKAYSLYGEHDDRATVNYSCVLIGSKNYREAIEILERMKANDSVDYLVYNNLGYAYFLSEQYVKALDNYTISIILEENNPLAYCNRGNLKYSIFKDTDGIEDLKKAQSYGDFEAGMILQNIVKEKPLLS
ncbi:MAG: hypothetical protein JST67_08600 [Bacteroidetes bacterium]|nr:hypothetical protein [Bacteroidota bacterium]